MEFKQIKELLSLVNSTEIAELEIEDEGFRLCIRKQGKERIITPAQVVETVVAAPVASQPQALSVDGSAHASKEKDAGLIEVLAPMVGTFYRAPAPDAPPYVQVGDGITEGQVLFIIEAMKMMNEIEAEFNGVIKQILVENGQPVEYGQPLLLIAPRA